MPKRIIYAIDALPVRLVAFVLLALALVSTGYVWYSVSRFESFVECQARWSSDLREYAEGTARAAAMDREVNRAETTAINRLVQDLTVDEIEDEEAIERWRESVQLAQERRVEIEEDREANPLPAPPIEVCNHIGEE